MKKEFNESSFCKILDSENPRGITRDLKWFMNANDYRKKDYLNFHLEFNDWIEAMEKEHGYNSTGVYN